MNTIDKTIDETHEEMLVRHSKEQRELVNATTSLKKQATKGEKRKKKEIRKQIEEMEADLKEKHAKELIVRNQNLFMLKI